MFKGWLGYFVGETHHQNFEDIVCTLSAAYLKKMKREEHFKAVIYNK